MSLVANGEELVVESEAWVPGNEVGTTGCTELWVVVDANAGSPAELDIRELRCRSELVGMKRHQQVGRLPQRLGGTGRAVAGKGAPVRTVKPSSPHRSVGGDERVEPLVGDVSIVGLPLGAKRQSESEPALEDGRPLLSILVGAGLDPRLDV